MPKLMRDDTPRNSSVVVVESFVGRSPRLRSDCSKLRLLRQVGCVLWRTHTDRRSEFVGKFFGQIIDNTIDHKEATMGNRTATGGDLPTSEPRSGVHDFDFLICK